MSRARNARVYAPPPDAIPHPPVAAHDDEAAGRPWMILAIMVIVMVTLGYVLWSMYGDAEPAGDAPVIAAVDGGFKHRYDGPPVDEVATEEIDRALSPRAAPAPGEVTPPAPPPKAVAKVSSQATAAPGAFVAQVASLRSEGAADAAWARLAGRDAALFASVEKDVQRADLGEKGVYYRVRAAGFADRAGAQRFCDRVRALGQECLVVAR